MEVALLYSGGKDSSLAAYILKKLGYEVKLINVNFGVLDSWKHAKEASEHLGLEFEVVKMQREILNKACEIMLSNGYPNNGLNYIHKQALIEVGKRYKRVADGTRRDDKVPKLSLPEIRSLEDKYNIEYIAPLRGLGYKTIRALVERIFIVEEGEDIKKADYEAEIRHVINKNIFPKHKQSKIIGMRV